MRRVKWRAINQMNTNLAIGKNPIFLIKFFAQPVFDFFFLNCTKPIAVRTGRVCLNRFAVPLSGILPG